jgi:hypothetical protein
MEHSKEVSREFLRSRLTPKLSRMTKKNIGRLIARGLGSYRILLLNVFFGVLALEDDPGWSGSVRDLLNLMEKKLIVSSAAEWMQLRELRNEMAHEYEETALQALYERARAAAPIILAVIQKVIDHEVRRFLMIFDRNVEKSPYD